VDSWKSQYSDDLDARSRSLQRLFDRPTDEDTFNALKLVLDKAPRFLQEYYQLVPDYEDGLRFVDFAYGVVNPYKRRTPEARFTRWNVCLITLKLEMLDKLGRWGEYRDYFNQIYALHPKFLSLLIPRYKTIVLHLNTNQKIKPKHSAFGIDEQTQARNYKLLAERLEMILKQDVNVLKLYV